MLRLKVTSEKLQYHDYQRNRQHEEPLYCVFPRLKSVDAPSLLHFVIINKSFGQIPKEFKVSICNVS